MKKPLSNLKMKKNASGSYTVSSRKGGKVSSQTFASKSKAKSVYSAGVKFNSSAIKKAKQAKKSR